MAFLVLMVNLFLSIKHIFTDKKRQLSLSIILLFLLILPSRLNSQELLFGLTGGLNMNTISSKNHDSGLKVGFNVGGLSQYRIDDRNSIVANLKFSTKGQQFSRIEESLNEYRKIYCTTTLYCIDVPILYQYYFEDLLGLEIGPTFNFCLGGKDKSKTGNDPWEIRKFEKGTFNPFEFGLTCGIFSSDLGQSPFNSILIEFRYFLGLTNFVKHYDRNTNTGVFLNIIYIFEKPLKK